MKIIGRHCLWREVIYKNVKNIKGFIGGGNQNRMGLSWRPLWKGEVVCSRAAERLFQGRRTVPDRTFQVAQEWSISGPSSSSKPDGKVEEKFRIEISWADGKGTTPSGRSWCSKWNTYCALGSLVAVSGHSHDIAPWKSYFESLWRYDCARIYI